MVAGFAMYMLGLVPLLSLVPLLGFVCQCSHLPCGPPPLWPTSLVARLMYKCASVLGQVASHQHFPTSKKQWRLHLFTCHPIDRGLWAPDGWGSLQR